MLIISHTVFNQRSGTVIALALTSQEPTAGYPLTYHLGSSDLPKQSWVKISQICTLSVERLGKKIGSVTPEALTEIIDGLNEIVGD